MSVPPDPPPTAGQWARWTYKAAELLRLIFEAGERPDHVLVELSEHYRKLRDTRGRHGTTSTTLRVSALEHIRGDLDEKTPVRKDPRREPDP